MKHLFYTPFLGSQHWLLILGLLTTLGASAQNLPTAQETANNMTMGWNLGNTLEAIGGETAWGNPLTTQRLIDSVKAAGFNTIRIPCSWDTHANQGTLKIDTAWIARVKQVVDYCVNRNLYVILNIHWDGGWLENNCTLAMKASVNIKQNAYWTQIANYFKSYDGHLLFASANEPNVSDTTQMGVLLSYHQTFINAVRATNGNNSSRVLIIQGPSTDIEKTDQLMNKLPTDQIDNRLMMEIHYYTPYQFCLMSSDASWGNMFYYWGQAYHSTTDIARNATWGEESALDTYFQTMKTKFVDKGIPVIIGEFAAIKRSALTEANLTLHLASREYYYKYLAGAAAKRGLIPVCWDTGEMINRNSGAVLDRPVVKAMLDGTGKVASGIDEVDEKNGIHLFPNPFTSTFQITTSYPGKIYQILVSDMLGNQLENIKPAQEKAGISMGSSLRPGAYIVRVYDAKGMYSFKVIKK